VTKIMRLATVTTPDGSRAARIAGGEVIVLAFPDVSALLREPDWRSRALGSGVSVGNASESVGSVPVVSPSKVICVGLNYRSHVAEVDETVPEHPTFFAKFPDVLTGARSPICLPKVSSEVDWEAELGVVIGQTVRNVTAADAMRYIAGFTVLNDVSMRDWQSRTSQWLAGKNFEASTPVGPVMVTADEFDSKVDLRISCDVDGVLMQEARTSELLFGLAELVSYISVFTTLRPGDLIATGTPAGVALGRADRPFLRDGQVVTTTIEGIGSCVNRFYSE
jgi:acylpyruvate hydrolase